MAEEFSQGRNLSIKVEEMRERMDEVSGGQARIEEMLKNVTEALNLLNANRTTLGGEQHVDLPPITNTTIPLITSTMTIPFVTSATTTFPFGSTITTPPFVSTVQAPPFSAITTSMAIPPFTSIPQGIFGAMGAVSNSQSQITQAATFDVPVGDGYPPFGNAYTELYGNTGPIWEQPHLSIPGQPKGAYSGTMHIPTQKDRMKEDWMEKMEEKIKAMQGPSTYGSLGVEELCPAIETIIPKDFKVPDFTKYDGSGNPLLHLKTYCTKMAVWSKDERFLVSFFHESLIGPALEWYIQLDHSKIGDWKDLADMFMTQYRFNLDTAPTREQLGLLQKKNDETFKQYAQRWRTLAAQVQPPLTLSEMCSYFLGTLGAPYIGSMVGVAYRDFADLITAGERIEILAKAGKLPVEQMENNQAKKGFPSKKKDAEVNQIRGQQSFRPRYPPATPRFQAPSYNPNPFPSYQTPVFPNLPYQNNPNPNPQPFQINNIPPSQLHMPTRPKYNNYPSAYPQNRPNHPPPRPNFQNYNQNRPQNLPPFPRLPITNTDLFQRLFNAHLISEIPVRPMQPPFPAWYNPNQTCKYHMGVTGHSIENCEGFKTAVRKLIACGRLDIEEEKGPNIINNPIPNHERGGPVNALEKDEPLIKKVLNLRTPMVEVFEGLKKAGYNVTAQAELMKEEEKYDEESCCVYHSGGVGHDIENCWDFKVRVQGLLTMGVIEAKQKTAFSQEINVVERFVLRVPPMNQPPEPEKVVVTVKKPMPFAYQDTHAVPWNYDIKVEATTSSSKPCCLQQKEEVVTNIQAVGGITRSGRFYSPEEGDKKKNKEQSLEEEKEKEKEKEEGEEEFLKIMKQSEFDVMEQLKKTPARISLLTLMLTSEPHRKALLKMLNEAYVKPDVTPQGIVSMVDPVKYVNLIAFSDEEIVSQPEKNPQALHITLKCRGFIVAKVLIDGGSALNVLPISTLSHLQMSFDDLTPQMMVVRAFDGTKRDILGEVVLPLEIGPSTFQVLFQVMEIEPAYTMLLGRPWIHTAGAVPSTLHQRVKYIENGAIITIHGEEEILVTKPVSVPYVDNTEQVEGNLWHSFEMVDLDLFHNKVPVQNVNQVVARIMARNGYEKGKGLGPQLQGNQLPVSVPEKLDRFGLGYEASLEEKFGGMTLDKRHNKGKNQLVPHIRETFPAPAEVIIAEKIVYPKYRLTINALEDDEDSTNCKATFPAADDKPLENWEAEPVIDVITSK